MGQEEDVGKNRGAFVEKRKEKGGGE